MDLISLIISVIGTIITIFSAIYAYRQAEKAKKSASEAEIMKLSIEREYKKIELGKLLNSTKSTIELTRNLTTPANPAKKSKRAKLRRHYFCFEKIYRQLKRKLSLFAQR